MTLLVVGSVAYDTVETRAGSSIDSLGGSATYCSLAARFFTDVSVVGVVGNDFLDTDKALLQNNGIDTTDLEIADGNTFKWQGKYDPKDFNKRDTIDTQLNVFANFNPKISHQNASSEFLFLGNIDPVLQLNVLEQMNKTPTLVGLDTMNYWIDSKKSSLEEIVRQINVLFMDETEIKEFTNKDTIYSAAEHVHKMGPEIVIVKKGEHGAIVTYEGEIFAIPAFPTQNVMDPTGAGDSFGGGFMGYMSSVKTLTSEHIRQAIAFASVMGSLAVENFSIDRLIRVHSKEIHQRFEELFKITNFDPKVDVKK